MLKTIVKFFSKGNSDQDVKLDADKKGTFILSFENLKIGVLSCEEGQWRFEYSQEFRDQSDDYNPIVGFPDLSRVYTSDTLWPFFRIRIPGLGQPAVKEILSEENIEPTNEFALLKRFGRKTLANPYKLDFQ